MDKISQQVACYNIALLECVCGPSAHVYIFVMMCLLAGRSCRPGLGWQQQQQARPGTRGFSLKLCLLTLCHRSSPDHGQPDMLLAIGVKGGHYTCTQTLSQAVFLNRNGTQSSVEHSNHLTSERELSLPLTSCLFPLSYFIKVFSYFRSHCADTHVSVIKGDPVEASVLNIPRGRFNPSSCRKLGKDT